MDLEEAIRSIPEKKLKLQNALNTLNTVATASPISIPNILQWKDLEAHFSAMEASIHEHLLQSKTLTLTPTPPKSLASLLASDPDGGLDEVRSQLALSPDPAGLVLDLMCRLLPSESHQRWILTCVRVLEELDAMNPTIDDSARARAKGLALKWKVGAADGQSTDPPSSSVALAQLQLVATYGLVGELDIEGDLLPALYVALRKKQAIHFVDRLGLREKLPEIIHKFSEDLHLVAVNIIYAFKLEDKFPVVPLLKDYINDTEKKAQEIREKGNYSVRSQMKANRQQLSSLREVLKLVEEHNLETEYPREVLEKGMSQLEHQLDPAFQAKQQKLGNKQSAVAVASKTEDQKSGKKRSATAASQTDNHQSDGNKQHATDASHSKSSELKNKRSNQSRPLAAATSRPLFPAHSYPSYVPSRAPYIGIVRPFGMAMPGTVPNYGGPNLSAATMGHRGPYHYPAVPYPGPIAQYDRSVAYGGHAASGFPPYYGAPRYR